MGCVANSTYDNFPKQKDKTYKYPEFVVGARVEVCYHYDTSKKHLGTVVRDDIEEPFETIIKLDNGRYVRGVECQYSYVERQREFRKGGIENMSLAELFKQAKDKGYNLTIQNDSNLDVVFVRMSQGIRRYNFVMSTKELLTAGDNNYLRK